MADTLKLSRRLVHAEEGEGDGTMDSTRPEEDSTAWRSRLRVAWPEGVLLDKIDRTRPVTRRQIVERTTRETRNQHKATLSHEIHTRPRHSWQESTLGRRGTIRESPELMARMHTPWSKKEVRRKSAAQCRARQVSSETRPLSILLDIRALNPGEATIRIEWPSRYQMALGGQQSNGQGARNASETPARRNTIHATQLAMDPSRILDISARRLPKPGAKERQEGGERYGEWRGENIVVREKEADTV
ncbi:hypothetical protein BDN71DRAFT_1494826 [Pleurotus eryngii]|uniref:Uncharacterized protein n=1 Tax=Pleurotus eryngii TaxID=5323 RepID=A0A9P6DHY4_PLEER|nr:hypothetical protein BDN71DRAFT_1494826 [Pleurotus eryngii]